MPEKQVVLITGGSKGVGAGIARSFLAAGAEVIISGRNEPETPIEAAGRQALFVATDVRDLAACEALVSQVIERAGQLDVLVNNAGGSPFAMADQASPRFHESIIRLNLLAPLNLAQLANQQMQKQEQGGVILNIGSVSAARPSPGTAAYGAAKAAVLNLTQTLAVEWAPKVRVNAVSPGPVLTEMSHLHYGDEAGIAAVASTIPMGRLAEPGDIGATCVWLASPDAAYVTGANIVLHGGGEKPAFLDKANVNK